MPISELFMPLSLSRAPRDPNESEVAKLVAAQLLESQIRANEKMVHRASQLRGPMFYRVHRSGEGHQATKRDCVTRQPDEPANKISQIDNDGFADVEDAGDAPARGENDPVSLGAKGRGPAARAHQEAPAPPNLARGLREGGPACRISAVSTDNGVTRDMRMCRPKGRKQITKQSMS